jgi:hypothetical protein
MKNTLPIPTQFRTPKIRGIDLNHKVETTAYNGKTGQR